VDAQPVLEVVGAQLRFAGDTALADVDFRMFPGEVHSLMGENGAGKSTLIKAITGALRLDAGSISVDGTTVSFSSPAAAQRAGIRTVYQEIDLLSNLSVAENIMLGREPRRFGFIDWRATRLAAREAMRQVGLELDPDSLLSSHSLAVQQLVAIARAVSTELRILILDEPTSSLDQDEVAELFGVIRELKARGVAILFVSHFLEQVYEICDRVTVLRNGSMVGEYLTTELLRIDLVQKMLGRDISELDIESRSTAPLPESDRRVVLSAVDVGRAHRITDLGRPAGRRGARPGRPARVRSHRTLEDPERGRPHRDRPAQLRGQAAALLRAARGSRGGGGVLLRGSQARGDHRRAHGAREHPARPPGRAGLGAPHRAATPRRADGQLDRGARHPPGQPGASGRPALGRQPAEGDAGAAARRRAARPGAR